MWKKIDNNISYVLKKKTSNIIKIWILFLLIGAVITFLIALNYNYYKSYKYIGYVKKVEDFRLCVYVKENKVSSFNDSKLFIENNEYSYDVVSISEDYYLVDGDNYYLLELKVSLDDKYLINNNILNIVIKAEKTTLLKELKKGLNL